ncbi:NAD(P)-binding protein [Alkalibaculum sp. M08DMB]|uniref:NAD(P)-binding protein n=1 Tax=Alkalibaculum sporogenes TaxID=2655001 RepID=A0A6A7KAS8_9FIRM|nr:FAD-dependent oxidoreductase [Alkalibaculum sporogenes]MPW26465.1 NAD(P)-binding protein [Alkalibaculum sporogenes]
MNKCKYPRLFTPITLGNTLFRNRIFASPTGYQNVNGDGYLNDGAAAYYERKARGGAASVASFEGIVDGEFGKGGSRHICLDTPNIDSNLSRIAHSVSSYGSVASLELTHTGMFANRDLAFFGATSQGIAYGPVECELGGRIIRPMDEDIIDRTIRKFAAGAALAKRCGFGMVTVHAGHGWLLHQFLSPKTNTRTDKWGGPGIENRARLVVAVCDAIRKEVGPGFPIEIRISGSECYNGGYDLDDGIAIAKQLDGHVNLIHVSAGNHEIEEVFAVTHPSMFLSDGCNVKYAAEIKKHVKTPVATIGALNDPQLMEEIIASGKADVVEVARQLLADPDFPNKVRSGNENKAKKCMRCLSCFSSELTNGEPYCAINPETGRELEMKYDIPTAIKKKVLVVGGGVGGMQAALTCSQRGHDVILCEKSSRLGGVLRCEEDVVFKKPLDYYLNQQAKAVSDSNIDLRLNTEVTPEYVEKLNVDVIFAALGAQAVKPKIPGIDGENVMSAQDAYTAIDKIGNKVVILGAGLVGIELGLHLISKGKKVKIIEMLDHISDGGNFLHILGLKVEINKRGLDIDFNTKAKEILEDGVICEYVDGHKKLDADTVIYAVGQKPLREEAISMNFCAPEFYQIGDCINPRNITSATSEAFMMSRNIGRF